jgi:hypothetical protein
MDLIQIREEGLVPVNLGLDIERQPISVTHVPRFESHQTPVLVGTLAKYGSDDMCGCLIMVLA